MTRGSFKPSCNPNEKGPIFSFVDLENIRCGLDKFLERKEVPSGRRAIFSLERLIRVFQSDRVFIYSAVDRDAPDDPLIQSLRSGSGFIFKSTKLTQRNGRRKQQGVDVLLAIDALKHAQARNMGSCRIFSGDGDFLPLIDALVETGVIVSTIGFGDPSKSEVAASLRDASDTYYQIGYEILFDTFAWDFGWRSAGSGNLRELVQESEAIETCFSELHGRVFGTADGTFTLIDLQVPLNEIPIRNSLDHVTFASIEGLEEWHRISKQV